uniref:Uncharacterized protein n=1 Tax=Brassica oleracea var. oleracea TaxID=109376 RepID=A0A0D3E892_BRAOL
MKMTSDQNLSHPVNCELLFLLPSHRSLSLIPSMVFLCNSNMIAIQSSQISSSFLYQIRPFQSQHQHLHCARPFISKEARKFFLVTSNLFFHVGVDKLNPCYRPYCSFPLLHLELKPLPRIYAHSVDNGVTWSVFLLRQNRSEPEASVQ